MQTKVKNKPKKTKAPPKAIRLNQKAKPESKKKAAKAEAIGQGLGSTR
jgi:hypothetical protein